MTENNEKMLYTKTIKAFITKFPLKHMHITMYTKNIAKSETIVFEKGMIRSYVSGIYTTDKSREIRLYSVLL